MPYQVKRQRSARQRSLPLPTWGGRRKGAGRKPVGRKAEVPHRVRPEVTASTPVHVTMKVLPGLPNLRREKRLRMFRRAFQGGKNRFGFRLVHFSVQKDHFHLIAEAPDGKALARGLQGLAIRLAKGINRGLGRKGRVFRDRYHLHVLRTPREVRHALSYVLNNAVKHGVPLRKEGMPRGLDGWSSARWFSGWTGLEIRRPAGRAPVVGARSWLLKTGWRRAGPVKAGVLP